MKKERSHCLTFNLRYQIVVATRSTHHDDVIPFVVLNIGEKGAGWQECGNGLKKSKESMPTEAKQEMH